jgi:hypothetical protein
MVHHLQSTPRSLGQARYQIKVSAAQYYHRSNGLGMLVNWLRLLTEAVKVKGLTVRRNKVVVPHVSIVDAKIRIVGAGELPLVSISINLG